MHIYNEKENKDVCKKNIICTPFAFKKESNTGVNVRGDAYTTYLKNACVALCSAKYYNPSCEVALVTNISVSEIPQEFLRVLNRYGIAIIEVPFDYFVFQDKYLWSLAFYKLCVLRYLCNCNYNNICYMDTDVYIQGSMDHIWQECKHNIMLYDINHGLQVEDYKIICEEFEQYYQDEKLPTHYGGEFFAASLNNSREFVALLEKVYMRMQEEGITTSKGDEFLISIVANSLRDKVKNVGAYIYRFWTAPGFRLVASCYEYNPIVVLHMPNEKNKGMIKLYHKYISRGVIPNNETVWRICRLSSFGILDRVKQIIKKKMKR